MSDETAMREQIQIWQTLGTLSSPQVMDEEEFLTKHGGSRQSFGDAGLHKAHSRVSRKQRDKQLQQQAAQDAELLQRRDGLRAEYARLVSLNLLRPRTRRERLEITAAGHSDNESTRAARRILVAMFGYDPHFWEANDAS